MAEQKQNASSFFDEMQGKFKAGESKRRKLSKTAVHSQPELLFLQFKPEGENFTSFEKQFHSQPSTSNRFKKSWHPPVKVITQPETFEFNRSLKRGLLSTDRLIDLDEGKNQMNRSLESISRLPLSNTSEEDDKSDSLKCDITNNINSVDMSPKGNIDINEDITETEFKHKLDIDETNNYSEHDDVLNPIDVILSEGEALNFELKMKGSGVIDIDEVLSIADEIEAEGNVNYEVVKTNEKKQLTRELSDEDEFTQNKIQNMKRDIILKGDKIVKEIANVFSHKLVTKVEEEDAEVSKLEDNLLVHKGSVDNHINNFNFNKSVQLGEKSMKADRSESGIQDEYSCLDLSHSQLMEIEKEYYEAPQNSRVGNVSVPTSDGTFTCNNCGITYSNEKKISVTTQTDLIWSNISMPQQQSLVSQIPPVQWPMKMQDTQTRLRATIQEIERLNAILLKARQEIWPHRNARNDPECSTKSSATNLWSYN